MIEFEKVSKVYQTANGPVHALREASFHVAPGEFVSVQGPSGCGKSTLLMLAGGLARPTCGRVVVAGLELGAAAAAELSRFRARSVGFVFQMFHLLPYLTVLDNVAAGALPGQSASARRRAQDLLERFQLAHRLKHRPAELSAGERQRVAVARAMINQPKIILADEPTGNLDPRSSRNVLELLAEFHRQGGTVLLVTHDAEAAGFGQRIILLEEGSLVEAEVAESRANARQM